ncbi:MAG: c-type cytochrome biogenesis protein CcmI [Beijerinckiaceae bacterium]
MMFWIAAAVMTGLTCLLLLQALAKRAPDAADHDRRFYDAQLAEIARQEARRLISPGEAEAARAEAARRLLAAAKDGAGPAAPSSQPARLGAVAVLALVPLVGVGAYALRGQPDMPAMPLASRADPIKAAQSGDLPAMIRQIEAHLAKNPDDGRGQELLAPVYLRLNRAADAAKAWGEAIRTLGSTAERQSGRGEALVFAADGTVSPEARAAFEAALALEPKQAKARFFMALAAEQAGDRPQALGRLRELHGDLPEGPLRTEIGAQIANLGGDAIAALPEAARSDAIRSMVEGLAERLAAQGGPATDWARLIRALTVLGEKERATAILGEARQKFADDAEGLRAIEEAAKPLP